MLRLLICLLIASDWFRVVEGQWPSVEVAQTRFTGVCGEAGQFDCGIVGENRCIPLRNFHDGHPNCPDGSDEYCFPGQIKCGSYCANLEHLADCLTTPRCADELGIKASPDTQEASFCSLLKRKLCLLPGAIPCKGYGECVLRKWLLDGKSDCFDGSDEEPQYANLFKFSERAGHHIQPIIVSTGGGQSFYPFVIPPIGPAPTEFQAPSPVPITIPPMPTQPLPTQTIPPMPNQPLPTQTIPPNPITLQQLTMPTIQPTKHPFQSIPDKTLGTLYPNQQIATTTKRPFTLYPNQQTATTKLLETLYPGQQTTHATLYPGQQTKSPIDKSKSSPKPTPTWWPFGRETFETTKEYIDKLDEFGDIYGPATHPWHSADRPTLPPVPPHQQHFTQWIPEVGINEGTVGPTFEEWDVFPKEGAKATSIEPTGYTVDLPVSPGAEVPKPWWIPAQAVTLTKPTQSTSSSPTLYPNQKVEQTRPTEDTKPFIVPGGGIFVWPNGTVNGPWLAKPTSTSTQPPFVPITEAQKTTKKVEEVGEQLTTKTTQKTMTTLTVGQSTLEPKPTAGIWLINPAVPARPNIPQSVTPVLIPPTYMPVVSTYPPGEKGPPVSTLLPIYPEEIGQNVKAPITGRPGQKPTAKVTEPVTIPAIQTTIGEFLGAETTTDEWMTKEPMTAAKVEVVPPQKATTTIQQTTKTTKKLKTTTTQPIQTTPLIVLTSEQQPSSAEATYKPTTIEWQVTTEHIVAQTEIGVTETEKWMETGVWETTTSASESSQSTFRTTPTSTSPTKMDQEPAISDWAPIVSVGGLAAFLGDAKLRKMNCRQKMQKVVDKFSTTPDCLCGAGEMRLKTGKCVRAPLATFRVKVKKLCGRDLEREDEKLAAQLVLLKMANGGTESACVREFDKSGQSFVLNAMCSTAANCSVEELQRSVSGRKQKDDPLTNLELEIQELQEGACTSDSLNDCSPGSICKSFGLRYHCHCPSTELDSKGNGQDCVLNVGCTRVLGLCLVVWFLIFLLSLCILPLLCGYLCYRCGYLQKTPIWPRLKGLGIFRTKRQDLEAAPPRPPSPQQKHNEGLPRPPDAPALPISRLPEIPSKPEEKEKDDSVPDYYKGNESEYDETDSASHGLVSLVSTEKSGVISEAETTDQKAKTTVEVHQDASRVDSKAEEKKAEEEEKRSTSSRAGTPTIWEKFQILGTQYATEISEKPPSETNSLDSLLRRYQEKEFVKLKEREPELFRIEEASPVIPSKPPGLQSSASLPQFTHIPPTPQLAQGKFFEGVQQQHEIARHFFQQPGRSASSPTDDVSSAVTPLPIEDAIAFAEQLNQEYKQKKEERKLKGEAETSTTEDNSSLASTLPPTPNSDELFHYPQIDNTYDYQEQEQDLSGADTKRTGSSKRTGRSSKTSKNGHRAATSDERRTQKVTTGRHIVQTADGTLNKKQAEELELAEALTSGQRPLPSHMKLKMPVDSPEASKKLPPQKTNVPLKKEATDPRQKIKGRVEPPQRQDKPPVPAVARRQPTQQPGLKLQGVRRSDTQKPPRPPSSKITSTSSSPPVKISARRPEAPTFGQTRSSTMSSSQKRQTVQEPSRRVASSLPNSDRRLKRNSLPMGDLEPLKRAPSLPAMNGLSKSGLKNADFILADIDLDLPGPHMIPATLDDIKSGRLAQVLAGTSKSATDGIIERVREATFISGEKLGIEKVTTTKQSISDQNMEMDPDLEDTPRLPPISDARRQQAIRFIETEIYQETIIIKYTSFSLLGDKEVIELKG